MTLPQPRPVIGAMPRYVPGARGQAGEAPPVKLSSNETALDTLPAVASAAAEAARGANRYADMFSVELTEALADRHGVAPEQVVVGGGSVAVLGHILHAFCAPGHEVVFAWRSFEAYPILANVAGATPVPVPLGPGLRHDLPAMAAAVTDRTQVLMVCTPNNPTGPAVRTAEFEAFMRDIPRHVLVVVDEAYVEFVRDADAVDGRAVIDAHPNAVVTRTFSKAYGLAGLRVGFGLGGADVIAPVRACVTPFSVSAPAQAAALAAVAAEPEVMERVAGVVAERDRVRAALVADGWSVPESEGNFVWLPAGAAAADIAAHLAGGDPPVLVRPFAGDGVRVSIGAAHENDAFLARLGTFPDRF